MQYITGQTFAESVPMEYVCSKKGGVIMTIADRIQSLRKAKGISQEELADKIGVSRQAVSKWESEQSSPDLEKVILLSDYFEVTTDFLLKGIEPTAQVREKEGQDAGIYAAVGTAFNFIGLVTAIMIWIEEQTANAVAVGFILIAFGCMIYVIGQIVGGRKEKAKKWFLMINPWIILLMPVTSAFNFIDGTIHGSWWTFSPFPQLYMQNSFVMVGLCWLCYIGICILVDIVVVKKSNA